ncbi:hypothetical protein [Halovivax sp.]|uniref:hypothetical protein n=1 Tax=Halovivax sp. TaxID=1935978 RepID=UPI0025C478C3|nr:hypothetical protein [Halovivax sp.]
MDGGERPSDRSSGPLDVPTLELIARRAAEHPLVAGWTVHPDSLSPRRLEVRLDDGQYPEDVSTVRLDVRWFEGGDYSFHYVETHERGSWQRRWDRHPKPEEPRAHEHPPPEASSRVEPSSLDVDHEHPLDVLFAVLDSISTRLRERYE